MEKRFRVFLVLVITLACGALAALGILTFTRLSDTEARLDREDRAAFAELAGRLADVENITGVKVQVASTMGDYRRYEGFDEGLLAGLVFVSHEYLYGGGDAPDQDIAITVTLYKRPGNPVIEWMYGLSDRFFGTRYLSAVEDVVIYLDGEWLRVSYGDASFTAASAEILDWVNERAALG